MVDIAQAKVGDRITLTHMGPDPDPVPVGSTGTIVDICRHVGSYYGHCDQDFWHQVGVDWDNGRRLHLLVPPDSFDITSEDPDVT